MKRIFKPRTNNYEAVFCRKNELKNRCGTYISVENHEKLSQLVNLGSGKLSMGGYIDNLLTQHFEEYRNEISLLFDKKFKKLF